MRYSGMIGFSVQEETAPDVYQDSIKEIKMYGDVLGAFMYQANSAAVNENLNLGHRISLIGGTYLLEHLEQMAYATLYGVRWEISYVEVRSPRVIITLGGKYNGPESTRL